jgi:hypothetical protein
MATTRNFMRRWFDELWNKGHLEIIDELVAPDCIIHGLMDEHGVQMKGPEPFKAFYHELRAQFGKLRIDVEDTLSDKGRFVARCVVRGTDAATGKPVQFGASPSCVPGGAASSKDGTTMTSIIWPSRSARGGLPFRRGPVGRPRRNHGAPVCDRRPRRPPARSHYSRRIGDAPEDAPRSAGGQCPSRALFVAASSTTPWAETTTL